MPSPAAPHTLALLTPLPSLDMGSGPHWGSKFVAIAYFQALFRYGPFDRYLFFAAARGSTRPRLDAMHQRWPGADRAEVFPLVALPAVLAETPIAALHTIENHLHAAIYARSLVPGARFPVTASAFTSPSYHAKMPEYGQDLTGGARPGDTVICMSDCQQTVLHSYYDHLAETSLAGWPQPLVRPQTRTVWLGIDVEQYRPVSGAAWRQRLSLPAEAFVVLSLGRLSPTDKMDWEPVLREFAETLAGETPDQRPLYLVLAGNDQGYRRSLEHWIQGYGLQERVRLVPDPPESEKIALLGAADCFLALPDNPQEAFGYSVLEAMACGLPIVAADWNGLKETVTPDVGIRIPTYWGPAVDRFDRLSPLYRATEMPLLHLAVAQSVAVDVAAAWEAVDVLRREPARCLAMGRAARTRAVTVFAWPLIIAAYAQIWAESAAQAATAVPSAEAGLHWQSAYGRAFRHYPSHWLAPETVVVNRQRRLHPSLPLQSSYPNVADLLDSELLTRLMIASSTPVSVAELLETEPVDADVLHYHLLWLIKQGLVKVETI